MEEDDKAMEMIRLPKQEIMYDRDVVLGRDVNSVFPNQAKEEKKAAMDDLSKALGLDKSRFISASELEKIKKTQGASVESGTVSRDKSLAAVLAENKAKKEEEFANVWKTMKQGKNRPLDEEDMKFVNTLADQEAAKENSLKAAERTELEAFQEAVRKAAEARQQANEAKVPASDADAPAQQPERKTQASKQKLSLKPVLKVKQKPRTTETSTAHHDPAEGTPSKRKRDSIDDSVQAGREDSGLGLMLGGYESNEE